MASIPCTHLAARSGPLTVPVLGVGCWSWGDDKGVWGWQEYDKELSKKTISEAFQASISNGLRLFDTAETYGSGLSESITGELLRGAQDSGVMVATKFQPGKWARCNVRQAMLQAAKESCERLGVKQIDLYQIHAPLHSSSFEEQGHALADVVDAGYAKAVGVSNFSLEELRRVHAALSSRGVPLASNQIEYSILRQLPDYNGMHQFCDQMGIKILAYSPLAMGRLTGKYSAKNEPKGRRGFGQVPMAQLEPLLSKLRDVAARHKSTPAQVALAWVIAKGAIPIPGAKNAKQAADNAAALRVQLTAEVLSARPLQQCQRIAVEGGGRV